MNTQSPELERSLPTEIERKFVVEALPPGINLEEMEGARIIQGYLANGSGRNTVRIRQKGDDDYTWTTKRKDGDSPMERTELECDITEEQFKTMWSATEGRRIRKTRYEIPYGDDAVIELDVFEGDNAGHMIAEVEFQSLFEAEFFTPPDWFGAEVTADNRYGNAHISRDGFPV
jgi:adenylate cyclase